MPGMPGMMGHGQAAGGGPGGGADPKTALNQMLQKLSPRALGKGDIVYTVNKFDSQHQAIVKLNCLDGKEYAGHLCATAKEAEKSAAEQALLANEALLSQIQNMPKAPKGNKRAAGGEPVERKPKQPKVKVPVPHLPFKTDLNNTLCKILRRCPAKGDVQYIVNVVAPGQHQATVQISCLTDFSAEWSEKAWAGELKPTPQEAEQSAAEQALKDVSCIPPLEKEKKQPAPREPKLNEEGGGNKKNKKKNKGGNQQTNAMQQLSELMNAWTEEVSKQEEEGETSLATKMMLWMMNGARGPPPQEVVTAEPVIGTVVTWKGHTGYLQPDEPLNHEAASQRGGRVWVHKKNLAEGVTELMEGMKVSFKVYCDPSGLGALECSIV